MRKNMIAGWLALGLLAGCAAPQKLVWAKDGATQADFDLAVAQCEYEITAATQATDYGFRTIFGQELDRALRKRDLGLKCMAAKGYRQVATMPASTNVPSPAEPTVPAAAPATYQPTAVQGAPAAPAQRGFRPSACDWPGAKQGVGAC